MTKIMNKPDHPYKPKYYKPEAETPKVITADHVARLYGVFIARMLSGNRSIAQMFNTREWFNAVASISEAMPEDALKDLSRCLRYVDDWEDEE